MDIANDMKRGIQLAVACLTVVSFLFGVSPALGGLINGSFELPRLSPGSPDYDILHASTVPGWLTTASDNKMEIWSDGFLGVVSYDAGQHVELNANQVAALFQDVTGVSSGSVLEFTFAHRGRNGIDTLELSIFDLGSDNSLGGGNDTMLFQKQYSTSEAAWAVYTSIPESPIHAIGNTIRFEYDSVSNVGNSAQGNFLDAADFGVEILIPEPSSLALLATGAICLIGPGWRRRLSAGIREKRMECVENVFPRDFPFGCT